MGVVGLGCDLLHVPRMEAALGRWGSRLLRKVLHADELSIFHLRSRPTQPAVLYLASRWAAKEAAFKAFGRGRGEVLFTEMKVANEPTGRPVLVLEGKTRKLAGELGITRTHLAISHEHSYALAHVIFERD